MKKLVAMCLIAFTMLSGTAFAAGGSIWFTDFNLHENQIYVNDNYNILQGYEDGSHSYKVNISEGIWTNRDMYTTAGEITR